jgi:hypothetical protein
MLFMLMLASLRGDRGATILARNVFVGAFHLDRPIAEDPVRRTDCPMRQPTLTRAVSNLLTVP